MELHASVVNYDTRGDILGNTLRAVAGGLGRHGRGRARLTLSMNGPHAATLDADFRPGSADNWVFECHHNPDNPGFGIANNRALLGSDARYLLILNPDAELADDALDNALALLESDPEVVAVAPRVVNDSGEREYLCKQNPRLLTFLLRGFAPARLRGRFSKRLGDFEMRAETAEGVAQADVPIASGCCLLVRGDAFRAIGGFDERYFLYFEDFDLSLRLAGHGRIVYLASMNVVHHGGQAARKGMWHIWQFLRSARLFFSTWGWRW